jgi:integration host factor subunit beta
MTKSALIEKVSEKVGSLTRKQTEIVVETVFDSIKESLIKGEKIEIRGFGNFKLKNRRPRQARNPKTGDKVDVPGKKVLHFKAGKALREAMNSSKAAPEGPTRETLF